MLERVQQAFASCPRPDHFTDYRHCAECAEHDEVLRSRDVDTLRHEDVGNHGWDPICYISPEGFAYYFPALARLALAQPAEPYDWYGWQLLFHLGCDQERIQVCTREQRGSVVGLLHHILETRAQLVDDYVCADALLSAIEDWSNESGIALPAS